MISHNFWTRTCFFIRLLRRKSLSSSYARFISSKEYHPGKLLGNTNIKASARKDRVKITAVNINDYENQKIPNTKYTVPKQDAVERDNSNTFDSQTFRTQLFQSSYVKTSQPEWNSKTSFAIDKAPIWFIKIHQDLMQTVIFPQATKGHFDYSLSTLQLMQTSELMSIAQGLTTVDDGTKNVVTALWRRLDSMSMEERLTVADIFYLNNIPSHLYYSALFSHVNELFEQLQVTPLQLTRLMFHIKVHGQAPLQLYYNIEDLMLEHFSKFSLNLITIVCHLFFIGQNRIQSMKLLDNIATRLLSDFESVNIWHLPLLMKMLRFSNYINVGFYRKLGNKVIQMDLFKQFYSLNHIMHFAFTYASVRISHPELFTHILIHCERLEHKARLKDVSKIVWACGTLVTNKPEQIETLLKIVEKVKAKLTLQESWKYPDNLVDLLMGLVLLNIYPTSLYNYLFHPKTIKLILGLQSDRDKIMQLQYLDHSFPIECPQYSGNNLSKADKRYIEDKMQSISLEMDIRLRACMTPALQALRNSLGDLFVQCKFVLPHFKTSDIIIVYDKDRKCFIKPAEVSFAATIADVKKLGTQNIERIIIQLLSKAQTTYDNKPLGMLHCKTRQLLTLGYKVITVDAEETDTYPLIELGTVQELLLSHIANELGLTGVKELKK